MNYYDRDKSYSMKAVAFAFIGICLVLMILTLFSCQKEPDCYVCQLEIIKSDGIHSETLSENKILIDVCDKTPQEIFLYEDNHTKSYTEQKLYLVQGYVIYKTIYVQETMKCKN